jgi:hypothetical protein
LIHARLSDFVLDGGVETSSKLEDDCNGVCVPREHYELPKLIDVGINVSLPLEIPIGLEGHERNGCLVLRAENRREFVRKISPGCKDHPASFHLLPHNMFSEVRRTSTFAIGKSPMDAGVIVGEVRCCE